MVAEFYLHRYASESGCTFGVLSFNGVDLGDTLENTSRLIPPGTYELETRKSLSFARRMVYLKNVNVMIREGNSVIDTDRCILLGVRDGLNLICGLYILASFYEVYRKFHNHKVKLTII